MIDHRIAHRADIETRLDKNLMPQQLDSIFDGFSFSQTGTGESESDFLGGFLLMFMTNGRIAYLFLRADTLPPPKEVLFSYFTCPSVSVCPSPGLLTQ